MILLKQRLILLSCLPQYLNWLPCNNKKVVILKKFLRNRKQLQVGNVLFRSMWVFEPRCMSEGYGSRRACVCVCVSVCLLLCKQLHTWFMCPKWGGIPFLVCFKTFRSGGMLLLACHDDQRLRSFSTKSAPMFLDTITNDIVCEPLARSDDYLN